MLDFFEEIFEGAAKLVRSVAWYDVVDILFVALALYYIIKLLRQTRAFHLVKGIVFMGLIYFVVSTFNMSASSYIFNQLFSNIVIVMLLLFQPELRHAIESFGRGDFKKLSIFSSRSSDFYKEESEAVAGDISKAVSNMSDSKTGALIVIEGKTPLGEIIATGSVSDAAVTAVLLENIFFPKSPLHDGAVVVRDNRIYAAGCILPLTQNEVSAELGTRHRAAIGMSEHSDALVVVVSEETGAVSVAMGGTLERNLSVGEVHEAISNFLKSDSSETGKSFKILRRKR